MTTTIMIKVNDMNDYMNDEHVHINVPPRTFVWARTPAAVPRDDISVARECVDRLVNDHSKGISCELTYSEAVNLRDLFYSAYPEL